MNWRCSRCGGWKKKLAQQVCGKCYVTTRQGSQYAGVSLDSLLGLKPREKKR